MYRIKHATVAYGKHTLLDDFSCEFFGGQLCMILGPNGAGKTTLLKCLDGEITPRTGEIQFNHQPLSQWPVKDLAKMRAVLPQYSNLDFPFTVTDVVLIGRTPHQTSDAENRHVANLMLEYCDCAHLANRAFPTLSGGEQQRVQTARVLAQIWHEHDTETESRFLLLDEPVSALDLSHQYTLLTLLKQLAKDQNLGIICSLHNLNLAAQFADRCLILEKGKLVADGSANDILTTDTLTRVFNIDMWVTPHPQSPSIPLIMPKLGNL